MGPSHIPAQLDETVACGKSSRSSFRLSWTGGSIAYARAAVPGIAGQPVSADSRGMNSMHDRPPSRVYRVEGRTSMVKNFLQGPLGWISLEYPDSRTSKRSPR